MDANGPKLGSKTASIVVRLSKALLDGESVGLRLSFADVTSSEPLFTIFNGALDASNFDDDGRLHPTPLIEDQSDANPSGLLVQKTRGFWSISYSDTGFARILLEYLTGGDDMRVQAALAAYLSGDDEDPVVSGGCDLQVGEAGSWVVGK